MRTRAAVERALGFGVSRVVIGTRAAESAEFVGELARAFGDKIAVGTDAKNGKAAVKGWGDTTDTGALELAKRMAGLGVRTLIYTDIGTDGMLTAPNLTAQQALAEAFPTPGPKSSPAAVSPNFQTWWRSPSWPAVGRICTA